MRRLLFFEVAAAFLFLQAAPSSHISQAADAQSSSHISQIAGPQSSLPHVPAYSISDLGPLADVADDTAISLSNSGYVALYVTSGSNIRASLWSRRHRVDLAPPPGYLNSMPHATNNHGIVVGWANTSDNPVDSQATTRAFVSDNKGRRVLGTLGGRDSRALGVNDSGRIVGVSNVDDRTRHAFTCDGDVLKDLGVLPGGKFSAAYAVNTSGDAAGVADNIHSVNHAVYWQHTKIHDLGVLPGGEASCAVAINAHGNTVGYSETDGDVHAFLYSAGNMRDLGVLKFAPSRANGINDQDEIVGTSNVSAVSHHAFLWRKGSMVDLNGLIPKDANWTLSEGCAINNADQVVCIADRRGEPSHALLLTPIKDPTLNKSAAEPNG